MADGTDEIVVTAQPKKRPDDELTLVVNGRTYTGWQEVEVTLRAEGFPNSFSISLSTGSASPVPVVLAKAGDSCTVLLGNDTVITGYIDRDVTGQTPQSHDLRIMGRGMTQDLVDCAAEWPDGQLIEGDALTISTKLALPYSIDVKLGEGASAGPKAPTTALNYGERGAEIIQRLARNAGLLAYEDSDGRLVLATVGTKTAAGGVAYGKNVQAWTLENSMDQRFSEIVCASFANAGITADLPGGDFFDIEKDPNVPRHRRLCLVLDTSSATPTEFTILLAKWEAARRLGRSAVVRVTIDSWRDADGDLWMPNTLTQVDLPGLSAADPLCIAEVSFHRSSDNGTTADLVLMPPAAFKPEPISLTKVNLADVKSAGE
jgi:prophage tail gpP-like protein